MARLHLALLLFWGLSVALTVTRSWLSGTPGQDRAAIMLLWTHLEHLQNFFFFHFGLKVNLGEKKTWAKVAAVKIWEAGEWVDVVYKGQEPSAKPKSLNTACVCSAAYRPTIGLCNSIPPIVSLLCVALTWIAAVKPYVGEHVSKNTPTHNPNMTYTKRLRTRSVSEWQPSNQEGFFFPCLLN